MINYKVVKVFQENKLKWDIEGAFAGLQIGAVLKVKTPHFSAFEPVFKNGIAPSARGGRFSSLTEVTINKPFVFAITDRATDTNLFLGIINNPKQ
jgi:serine protease inhibitor